MRLFSNASFFKCVFFQISQPSDLQAVRWREWKLHFKTGGSHAPNDYFVPSCRGNTSITEHVGGNLLRPVGRLTFLGQAEVLQPLTRLRLPQFEGSPSAFQLAPRSRGACAARRDGPQVPIHCLQAENPCG